MLKRVFITGGASGLGKAIAMRYAREGHQVCIGDVNLERGAEAEAELKALQPDSFFQLCDVRDENSILAVKDELMKRWRGVDIVVNNAGVGGTAGGIEEVSLADWDWVVDINLMGVVRGCRVFTPVFKAQGDGYFVNIASAAGLMNAPKMAGYNVAKAGVISLSETLRVELSDDGIHTSVVCPAFFPTNLTESLRSHQGGVQSAVNKLMKRSGVTAENVADAIFDAVRKKQFWVVTHKPEKRMWQLKRVMPDVFSFVMAYQTKKFLAKKKA
ncbi:short-chain dehydrogenase/reductase SDR [Oleiphilus messinensis]|uniref:Short-chain dehydrogenase/reductase SDR n=1 Tax=Oleiphilus messinensis TaxID=141451 RepID=A0A1Y0ID54_9GAMM|nr:SDR family oxidoreductase [Oleiphilus messinensis]ARU58391.1 short-chain dehydrogenase/reductase SDR [Oleiphilus messinensis]